MEKRYLFIILLTWFSIFSYGQKTQQVNNGYEKGLIADGYKKGIWEYYDNGVLKLKVDYTAGKLTFLASDTSKYAIKTKTGWELSQLDIYPHFLGSNDEIIKILVSNIRYPEKAKNGSITGTVLIGFEINLQGHVDSVKILKDIGEGCGEEVLRAFQLIPDYWLVAQKNGKQYTSRFILPVKFRIDSKDSGDNPQKEQEELKRAKALYAPTNYFPELIISTVRIN